jgi:hypothetical protein
MAIFESGLERSNERIKSTEGLSGAHPLAPELQRRIADEAYRLSELRGFESGFEDQDWIAAKRMVMESFLSEPGHR